MMMTGLVSLVGAGPGDPELLTIKALRRLQAADVVIYDSLIDPVLLEYASASALTIYVGKRAGHHTLSQEAINELLIAYGRAGCAVVRLKGGDPFIFGRGGEEATALQQAGVRWEVIPGISSAIAAPAYAGIPLTHRDLASSCTIMTGHRALQSTREIDATGGQHADTLVILMGVQHIRQITNRLIAHGWPATTPAAIVRWGTTPQQASLFGTLATIADQVEYHRFAAPAVIVVGAVVSCAAELNWFQPMVAAASASVLAPVPAAAEDRDEPLPAFTLPVIERLAPRHAVRAGAHTVAD
ncbi:MAG: uroporphyrinogen-III C-methyltransferase [Chloroflexaceae bacterium]|nr:uroporphyrinogen-III C-methyltransferase [Chloroflexaceae bacterium]NJL32852.1 uroporphyrinogen-III C-methyltransferase [Chloroflexaceae bacterium]NJO05815.1 uroporphyrinogen-III C-methyltransferase [Chloroflexaceae bacterium]